MLYSTKRNVKMKDRVEQQILVATNDFCGPVRSRKCTDITFIILFVLCFLAMNLIGFAAVGIIKSDYINAGNPMRLLRGIDYMGNICGVDKPVSDLKIKWQPNPFGINPNSNGEFVPIQFGICLSSCPSQGETRSDPYGVYGSWVAPTTTSNVLGYCVPADTKRVENVVVSMFGDFIRSAWLLALLGFLLAVIVSMVFLITVRVPCVLRGIVWLCITVVFVTLVAGGYTLLQQAKVEEKKSGSAAKSEQEILMLKAVGGILALGAVLWVSFICFMRDRIALAIGIVRESAKALTKMPLLCFFPIVQSALLAGFTALWLFYSVYLISSGEVVTSEWMGVQYKSISYDVNSKHAIAFLVFCWLWNMAFLDGFGQLTSAHAVLVWYFSTSRSGLGSWQVVQSVGVCLRYHTGTVALGSFIIAVVQLARMVLEYVKGKLEKRQSFLTKCLSCSVSCCLYCFENCLKYLSSQAFVQTALFGTPFCLSAIRAFGLIVRNLGRVAAVTVVGDFVVIIGKLSITLTCAGLGYYYMSRYLEEELSGLVLPTLLIGYVAYCTASLFLGVVSATSHTILQAYIAEEEMASTHSGGHDPSLKERMAELRECTQEVNQENWSNVTPTTASRSPLTTAYAVASVEMKRFGTSHEEGDVEQGGESKHPPPSVNAVPTKPNKPSLRPPVVPPKPAKLEARDPKNSSDIYAVKTGAADNNLEKSSRKSVRKFGDWS